MSDPALRFSILPALIRRLLGDEPVDAGAGVERLLPAGMRGYDRVISFFIDSFGWHLLEKVREESPPLNTLLERAVVSRLRSLFPSATAGHVTCIHTGQPPGQSGFFEWQFYIPEIDEVIYSLLWMRTVDEAARPLLARWRPEDFLRRNRAGRIIAPAGGLRDFFLHVHPEAVPACVDFLAERLEGIAEVVTLQHLVNRGLFGEEPVSDRFRRNAGNVVILPRDNQGVWWSDQGRFRTRIQGHHGGTSPAESEIPLIALEV